MKLTGENRSTRGKTFPSATLSTTNPTWTDPNRCVKFILFRFIIPQSNTFYQSERSKLRNVFQHAHFSEHHT